MAGLNDLAEFSRLDFCIRNNLRMEPKNATTTFICFLYFPRQDYLALKVPKTPGFR